MKIEESLKQRESSLLSKLLEKQAGIDDRTGKGLATEAVVESELLRSFLPSGFDCGKGSVVSADRPTEQSAAFDRVIFDRSAGMPLLYDQAHSIFPIEVVAGIVEITMHLDPTKLRTDIERMVHVKGDDRAPLPGPNTGHPDASLSRHKEISIPTRFRCWTAG
jgi:hypothetical protein